MNIVVLCGGDSPEREVSISSGSNVCEALRKKGHNAVLLDVYFGMENENIFEEGKKSYNVNLEKEKIHNLTSKIEKTAKTRKEFFGQNVIKICQKADVVFMALHGKNGEDGKCQAAFDLFGIKYTGSGHLASAMGMDKAVTKQIFLSKGVPTAKSVWIKKGEPTDLEKIGMEIPVVVKACNGGSSVGVVLVQDKSDYESALKECFALDDTILVEDYIEGREFSVGVINDKALPVVEIIPKAGWYDYKNKYEAGAVEEVCPAELSHELTEKMQKVAENAYSALGCRPYARADIMMDKDNNMYCLEVNTLPGMTKTSLIPRESQAMGVDFPTLCENIVMLSL